MTAACPHTVIDVETSEGRIIEVAAVRIENGRPVQTFATLVNPGLPGARCPLAWGEGRHGLRPDDVRSAPTFAEVATTIWLVTRGSPIVAHNASFERRHLCEEFRRLGLDFRAAWVDTLTLARVRWPTLPSHRLTDLCAWAGIPNPQPHRALSDALSCAALFARLCASGPVPK